MDSTNSDPDFMKTIITGDESWVYWYDPVTNSFRHFPYNDNSTRALNNNSLKYCLASTDAIDRRETFTHAYEGSRSPHASALSIRSFDLVLKSLLLSSNMYTLQVPNQNCILIFLTAGSREGDLPYSKDR
jgi:hypothetical protein